MHLSLPCRHVVRRQRGRIVADLAWRPLQLLEEMNLRVIEVPSHPERGMDLDAPAGWR